MIVFRSGFLYLLEPGSCLFVFLDLLLKRYKLLLIFFKIWFFYSKLLTQIQVYGLILLDLISQSVCIFSHVFVNIWLSLMLCFDITVGCYPLVQYSFSQGISLSQLNLQLIQSCAFFRQVSHHFVQLIVLNFKFFKVLFSLSQINRFQLGHCQIFFLCCYNGLLEMKGMRFPCW